jgi:hypothetical protein
MVADATDPIVQDVFEYQGFQVFPPLVTRTIRRYQSHQPLRDVEIEIFRDEAVETLLRVRIQARVLVHPVQRAFKRAAPTPSADAPPRRFQLGPHADDSPGSWTVTAPGDVTVYAAGLFSYLREIAVPWLRNTESLDAVIAHLAEMNPNEDRDRLIKALKAEGRRA